MKFLLYYNERKLLLSRILLVIAAIGFLVCSANFMWEGIGINIPSKTKELIWFFSWIIAVQSAFALLDELYKRTSKIN